MVEGVHVAFDGAAGRVKCQVAIASLRVGSVAFSLEETEGTYGQLEPERHERRVNLDSVLGGVQPRPPASTIPDAGWPLEDQLCDISHEDFMVEGKGFEPSTSALRTPRSPN